MQACTGTILVKCERGNKTLKSFNTFTSPLSDSPEDYSVTVMSKAGYCCAVSGTSRFVSSLYFLSEFFCFRCDDLTSNHSLFSVFFFCFFFSLLFFRLLRVGALSGSLAEPVVCFVCL